MFERRSKQQDARQDDKAREASVDAPADTSAVRGDSAQGSPKTTAISRSQRGEGAMIGAKVRVTGDIVSSEDLFVEGEVNGTITLPENELVVGTSGRVKANISAKTVRIEGEVNGDVEGNERVVICASGNVEGNVSSPRVVLEDGGRFKGSIDMGGSKSAAAKASTTPKAAAPAAEVSSIEKTG
jgi:cytoskeletal protein CcmA (bactofilin family)